MNDDIKSIMKPHTFATKRRGEIYSLLKKEDGNPILVSELLKSTSVPKKYIYWTLKSMIKNRLLEKTSIPVTRKLKSGKIKEESRMAVKFVDPWSRKLSKISI